MKKTLARETLFLDSTRQPNYSEFECVRSIAMSSFLPSTFEACGLHVFSVHPEYFNRAFIPFELIDMPGNQLDPQAFGAWPDQISACIFVLDGQALPDASPEVANSIARSIISLYMANPEIQFHVFLHKMETGTPDGKLGRHAAFFLLSPSFRFKELNGLFHQFRHARRPALTIGGRHGRGAPGITHQLLHLGVTQHHSQRQLLHHFCVRSLGL